MREKPEFLSEKRQYERIINRWNITLHNSFKHVTAGINRNIHCNSKEKEPIHSKCGMIAMRHRKT